MVFFKEKVAFERKFSLMVEKGFLTVQKSVTFYLKVTFIVWLKSIAFRSVVHNQIIISVSNFMNIIKTSSQKASGNKKKISWF